ncbi:iron complex transport system substrate-binding protein [Halopolyspora algeriensis]|uniref:Iron complex transport system substrate-binding protein n=1 Tax=Halopolyspora algeriensis TaxID=1500506 RepID=A0A368VG83_9ACTN|nr:iron-siderophore ABC transporter substrate-binding protein [Halopolyspora algeriensis]RCW40165.1 iron complex transport system substrate-binding protein [Halopolyspora algeriensis]TQM46353.1 iron complex transport system substrate-binding protein [Halopolyspora algeriensis]
MSTFGRLRRAATRAMAVGAACGLATLGVTACGTEEQAPAQSGGDTRVVEHAMGKTPITGKPQRIVTLDATFTSAVMALDSQVVGYTTFGGRKELPEYLGKDRQTYGAQAQWVGSLSNPNLEKIVQLDPDLILSAKVRHEQLYEQLSEIAPTVFSQTTGGTWKENLLLTGRALGKAGLAERKLDAYEQRAKTVGDNVRNALGRNPTMSIVRFAGEPTVRLYTKESFPGIVQSDTGLARPEGQPTTDGIAVNLSQERILELDADHIFITVYPDKAGDAAETRNAFRSNPLWNKLTGEKHTVNDITWMTSVGLHGAHAILDDIATTFGVDPAR